MFYPKYGRHFVTTIIRWYHGQSLGYGWYICYELHFITLDESWRSVQAGSHKLS